MPAGGQRGGTETERGRKAVKLQVDIVKNGAGFRVDAQFEAGEGALALLGASGSGKSEVLRCVAGLSEPDEGRILLDGEPLFDSSRHLNVPPQRRKIGLLTPGYALFPHLTVRRNIAAGVVNRAEREHAVEEQLRRFRLTELAERKPRQISELERQRVALARLTASRPVAILLDEPLSGRDSFLKFRMEQELSDYLSSFGGPVVWASHDRGEVYRNCRYVCVLENGLSQETISVERLLASPGTEGAARLSGCKNIVDAIPRHNAIFIPEWGVTLRSAYPIPPLLRRVGIRAHQVRISEPALVNAFAATVVRVIEDVSSTIVLLRPNGASEEAPLLRMELDRGVWRTTPDQRNLTVSVGPQDVLLLR
ncbi:MAG: ATP-binding cassette domain-containing protein [Oscillibacter sp.]|nr:ATP-binding cassette domain-containing protein [Oscillibacter sp.]